MLPIVATRHSLPSVPRQDLRRSFLGNESALPRCVFIGCVFGKLIGHCRNLFIVEAKGLKMTCIALLLVRQWSSNSFIVFFDIAPPHAPLPKQKMNSIRNIKKQMSKRFDIMARSISHVTYTYVTNAGRPGQICITIKNLGDAWKSVLLYKQTAGQCPTKKEPTSKTQVH